MATFLVIICYFHGQSLLDRVDVAAAEVATKR